MKINILSLFPEIIEAFKSYSVIAKALQLGHIEINVINFREFSKRKHHEVDDTIYGGGGGMLLQVEPIHLALQTIKQGKKYLISPQGQTFSQQKAHEMSKEAEITLVCGHYEGFDERVLNFVDEELSIGDYILTGGEIPAMVITETIARLCPGVIKKTSHENESFEKEGLLECPQYTKPADYLGYKVPKILLSGNHKEIEEWRNEQAYLKTNKNRKDIILKLKRSKNEK